MKDMAFTVSGADSVSLIAALDVEGIYASSGSACSAGSLNPSHVVMALGKKEKENSLIRFSLGRESSEADVDYVCASLPEIIQRSQRGSKPVKTL